MLIVYHAAISFQPWADKVLFIKSEESIEGLWIIMSMLNIWRIPILFLVSGMGVRFAMERRNSKQLLKDRALRILLPFSFGFFFVAPIPLYLAMRYYGQEAIYTPTPMHLWFLANIFLYVLLLLPLLSYLKNHPGHRALRFLEGALQRPWTLFLAALPIAIEAWLLAPPYYTLYAMTAHGFWLGMVCFIMGFVFVGLGDAFWQAVTRIRHSALAVAFILYLLRLLAFELEGMPNAIQGVETACWMLAILGYGALHLNRPSAQLAYLSAAVYPIYIIHMPIQYGLAYYLMPLALPAVVKLVLLLVGTLATSALLYGCVIRRLQWIRPLFGMKRKDRL